jgi:hypothetical protein
VIGVSTASHGRLNASFCQAFCVADGEVLHGPIAVMDKFSSR